MNARIVIEFLRDVYFSAQLEGSRSKIDIFSDRLLKSTSEPTLAKCMENLIRAVNARGDKLNHTRMIKMLKLASSQSEQNILAWIRIQTRIIAMLATTTDTEILEEVLSEIYIPETKTSGSAAIRQAFDIPINILCEAPITHGSDAKAGNATLFRRIDVLATNGSHMFLPYYSGNAIRGQVRDLLADHFLDNLGISSSQNMPSTSLWFFYALYSGGILEEKSGAIKAIKNQMGGNGAIKAEGVRNFRNNIPPLSLLGCALGNRVLPGHVRFADIRPICVEWGTGEIPVAELMTWEFLTRREDYESYTEHHGMITNTEVLRAGAELEGGIDIDKCMPEIEKSALGCGLKLLVEHGMIGGENRRGLGRVKIQVQNMPDPYVYEEWIKINRQSILRYMEQIGAVLTEEGIQ